MIAQASGGLMSITGEEDGKPCKAGATVGDTGTGMVMAISILAAYVRRLRTGQGEHLVVGMQDSVIHYIRNAFAYMDRSDGKAAPRIGSRTVGAASRRSASTRARAADRTTTSISTRALPVLSTGTACSRRWVARI